MKKEKGNLAEAIKNFTKALAEVGEKLKDINKKNETGKFIEKNRKMKILLNKL